MTKSLARLTILGMLALGGSGCQDYLARRDSISAGSGEAVQANIAKHTIDPWSVHSRRVDPYTDGDRIAQAVQRYRNPVSGPGSGPNGIPPVPTSQSNIGSLGTSTQR